MMSVDPREPTSWELFFGKVELTVMVLRGIALITASSSSCPKNLDNFSICAYHPCVGAILIFYV